MRRGLHRALLRFPGKASGKWGIVLRRLDLREGSHRSGRSVRQARARPAHLAKFPEGYRHLAYLQSKIGYPIKADMPGLEGPALEELYAWGETWLKGKRLPL